MTLIELVQLLNTTGYPVVFSHFKPTESNPVPQPPYIAYTTPEDDIFFADNKVYAKATGVDIELYTDKKDLVAEKAIEDLLDANDIPYTATQVYIESEDLHQKTYEIGVI